MRDKLIILMILSTSVSFGQQQTSLDSLKREILLLRTEVENLELDMAIGEKKFKRGILVATIGYSVTIAGGLMLGRKYDDAGKVLLIAGGTTGIIGTVLMVDSFKYLGRAHRRNLKQSSRNGTP
ncbi:MAG TPA: hypothetical protein VFZ52_05885 [Chryseolinea sp.]